MGLTRTQYNTIMRDYERRQAQDRRELEERTREIYDRFPEFSEIDARIASAGTACARRLLSGETGAQDAPRARAGGSSAKDHSEDRPYTRDGWTSAKRGMSDEPRAQTGGSSADDDAIDSLRVQIGALSARRAQILRDAGYPADYLEPHYRCADCQDTGYIGSSPCHCFRQAAIDLLYTQSALRDVLREENFSTFSLDYYSDQITDPLTGLTSLQTARRALEECLRFVREFDREAGNLFLYGDTGLGKTFLAHCVAKELLESAHSVAYFSSFRLFELFADTAFGRSGAAERSDLEQHIFECDLLIIDDLGTELVNSFVASELFHVLNERILNRKSTLISTNLTLSTFADTYSERVFSRISSNYTMLKMIGEDIRLRKKFSAQKS